MFVELLLRAGVQNTICFFVALGCIMYLSWIHLKLMCDQQSNTYLLKKIENISTKCIKKV